MSRVKQIWDKNPTKTLEMFLWSSPPDLCSFSPVYQIPKFRTEETQGQMNQWHLMWKVISSSFIKWPFPLPNWLKYNLNGIRLNSAENVFLLGFFLSFLNKNVINHGMDRSCDLIGITCLQWPTFDCRTFNVFNPKWRLGHWTLIKK